MSRALSHSPTAARPRILLACLTVLGTAMCDLFPLVTP